MLAYCVSHMHAPPHTVKKVKAALLDTANQPMKSQFSSLLENSTPVALALAMKTQSQERENGQRNSGTELFLIQRKPLAHCDMKRSALESRTNAKKCVVAPVMRVQQRENQVETNFNIY